MCYAPLPKNKKKQNKTRKNTCFILFFKIVFIYL